MFDKRMFAGLSVGITSFLQPGLCLNSFRHLGERTKSLPEPSVSKRSAFKKKKNPHAKETHFGVAKFASL